MRLGRAGVTGVSDWRATYRLQFHAGFTFDDALRVLPYLCRLGISHVYASPIQGARPGSTHGYDQVDPTCINPELGGELGFERFSDALRAAGLGLLVDIVPNHMAAHRTNPWWMSALAGGPEGPAAGIFDIDWDRHSQVLLPVLGGTLAETLQKGDIALSVDPAGWLVACAYGEHAWPLRAEDTSDLLEAAALPEVARQWREDQSPERAKAREAVRRVDAAGRERLAALLAKQDLSTLIARQHWRPTHWRAGRDALSTRRFFNINDLIGVRVEAESVFALMHQLPLALLRAGRIDGLRIDHIDGLADPAGYCARLRSEAGAEALIVVEKILGEGEGLRTDWPVDGTTGYERLNMINRLFVCPVGHRALAQSLASDDGAVAGDPTRRLAAAKRQVLEESFTPEIEQLTELAVGAAASDPALEFAAPTLRAALTELIVHFPVYRSYLVAAEPAAPDRDLYAASLSAAEACGDPWITAAANWIADTILHGSGRDAAALRRRFQQLTGPLMAKGLEDTEFYRSVALLSPNEVGGDPASPSISIPAFHTWAARRGLTEPRDITPLATHDTKRGAETRARLNLLSHAPAEWIGRVARWRRMNAGLHGKDRPDTTDQWLVYQTLFGAWPICADRLCTFVVKALREAKRHTRWENPNEVYERSALDFAEALLEHPDAAAFRSEMDAIVAETALAARYNGLAQAVLQLTLPGVVDIYQGTEFWDFSLVDPDNRRLVDYEQREDGLGMPLPPIANDEVGLVKQRLVQRLLHLRQSRPELFRGYAAIPSQEDGWIVFTRGGGRMVVAVSSRNLGAGALPRLPDGVWHDVLADMGADVRQAVRILVKRDGTIADRAVKQLSG
nr:malto-oligosyltrehalose synthase [Neoroseomonas terrae]